MVRSVGVAEILILVFVFGPLMSSSQNADPITLPNRIIPGETLYDGFSAAATQLIYLVPFLLGRQLLRGSRRNKTSCALWSSRG